MTGQVLQTTECPVCGSGNRQDIGWPGPQRLLGCRDCGAVHAADYDDPAEVYRTGYHSGGTGYHVDTTAEPFRAYLAQVNRQRLDLVDSVTAPPGRWFDVGCGEGTLLLEARERGWQVGGLEPVEEAVASGRGHGLDLVHGRLEDIEPSEAYDVVSAVHVLEHVPDVPSTLRRLLALVRPGGHLVVEVPNWRSMNRRSTGAHWPLLAPGEHVTHFTPSVLSEAVLRAGGRPVLVRTPSWLGAPQSTQQALIDLGLRHHRRLRRLLSQRSRGTAAAASPSRGGWLTLRALDRIWSRGRIGMVILLVAQRLT